MIEFKDVAHFYLGCELQYEQYKGLLTAVLLDKNMVVFRSSFAVAGSIVKAIDVKPILKPLVIDKGYSPAEILQLAKEGYDLFGLIHSGQAIEYKETNEETA